MPRQRTVDLTADRDTILRFHALGNYHSDSPWATEDGFDQYLEEWLATSQPDIFLSSLADSMKDERSIAEPWEDDGQTVGFLWVGFCDIVGYSITVAEVNDLEVSPDHWRRGFGTNMLEWAERVARDHSADLLRSETEADNLASRRLHEGHGFATYGVQYEKLLTELPRQA